MLIYHISIRQKQLQLQQIHSKYVINKINSWKGLKRSLEWRKALNIWIKNLWLHAYNHIPTKTRKKLEPRVNACYYVDCQTVIVWQFLIFVDLWYIMVDVWKTFCNNFFQLMVVYIPIYHCIMKLEQIWKNSLLIGVHFQIATTLSKCYNYKKNYKVLNSAHTKIQPWRKIFFIKIFYFFSSCEVHIKCFKNIC